LASVKTITDVDTDMLLITSTDDVLFCDINIDDFK